MSCNIESGCGCCRTGSVVASPVMEMGGKGKAFARLALGLAQMIGAMVSVRLLMSTGASHATLAAVLVTCALVIASVLLWRRW